MSTAKRSRARPSGASAFIDPASKRRKTTDSTHVPGKNGLGFLVDEDARSGRKLDAKLTNGVPSSTAAKVDESHARVAQINGVHDGRNGDASSDDEDGSDVPSLEEDEDEDSDSDEGDADDAQSGNEVVANGTIEPGAKESDSEVESEKRDAAVESKDVEMEDDNNNDEAAEMENDENQPPEEPSFADLLRSRYPGTIDVQASGSSTNLQVVPNASGERAPGLPVGTSLTTVLTQALKTNDRDLLESCLQTTDLPSVRATIQRLQSQHVGTLLQRLAERIHNRPGRTGPLMVWIQWSLVAHGAYLATQPDVMKKVRSLHRVVKERASGLQPLLHLKGKLDMLSAQLELRRDMQAASRLANADPQDDEVGVVYVDGQDEEDWSESEEEDDDDDDDEGMQAIDAPKSKGAKQQMPTSNTNKPGSDLGNLPNGAPHDPDSSEDSDDSDDDEQVTNGIIDNEAQESSDDEISSAEEDSSAPESEDEDDISSEDESDASVQDPQFKTMNRKR